MSVLKKIKSKAKGAWNRNKKKPPKTGGGRNLPDGIVNGVMQFVGFKIDETDKGTPFVSLSFVCQTPDEVQGRKWTRTHYLAESEYRTIDEVFENFTSDLQHLGADLDDFEIDDIPKILKSLERESPFILFNTEAWEMTDKKTKKTRSGVSVYFQGIAEDFDPDDYDDGEDDDPPEDDDEDSSEDDEDQEDESSEEDDSDDSDEDSDDDADSDDSEDWSPEEGELYEYKASPRGKPKKCEVTSVDTKKQTVDLKRDGDGKEFSGVAWDKLIDIEE